MLAPNPFLRSFVDALQELRWIAGQNVDVEYRWAGTEIDSMRTVAQEIVASKPYLILAYTTPVTAALHQYTKTIPIVFIAVSDPIGSQFVASLARPGGNVTGFINVEASLGGKWLELLKEIAPRMRRATIMFNPATAPGGGSYFIKSFTAAAQLLQIEPMSAAVQSDGEIEAVIAGLGRASDGGLVVSPDAFTTQICFDAPHRMLTAYCAGQNQASCRLKFPRNSN
jgi:putative tryptophan/tyrosine transport system substrate-binding protein